MSRIMLAGLMLAVAAPAIAQEEVDHLHWRPAGDEDAPRPWAVILPGGGGLDIFGDEGEYYFSFAEMLNERGIDVLVVHYQEVARPAAEVGMANYGAEIARAVDEGVAHSRALGRMEARCDGLVFAWSMGGQGLLELAGRPTTALPGLTSAIAYYPSVQGRPEGFTPQVDLTILQGEADQMTTLAALDDFLAASAPGEPVALHTFAGAQHGFDITTLEEPVLEGRFAFDSDTAAAGRAVLRETLDAADYGCALD